MVLLLLLVFHARVFTNLAPWAGSVIESQCPSGCMLSRPNEIFVEASHWPSDHMISSRPFSTVFNRF